MYYMLKKIMAIVMKSSENVEADIEKGRQTKLDDLNLRPHPDSLTVHWMKKH